MVKIVGLPEVMATGVVLNRKISGKEAMALTLLHVYNPIFKKLNKKRRFYTEANFP
jgi:hypothetical protein